LGGGIWAPPPRKIGRGVKPPCWPGPRAGGFCFFPPRRLCPCAGLTAPPDRPGPRPFARETARPPVGLAGPAPCKALSKEAPSNPFGFLRAQLPRHANPGRIDPLGSAHWPSILATPPPSPRFWGFLRPPAAPLVLVANDYRAPWPTIARQRPPAPTRPTTPPPPFYSGFPRAPRSPPGSPPPNTLTPLGFR